jgi:hypothetical protein
MEAMVYSGEFIDLIVATAGLWILFAAAIGGLLLLGYVADEEAKGRRLMWLEEPIATVPTPVRLKKVELRKAA